MFDQTDVGSKLNILNDTLQSFLSLHAPVKQIKLRSRPYPFVNQEIKDLMRLIPSKDKQRPAFTKDVAVLTNEFNQFFAKVGLNAADAAQRLRENIIARDFSSENGIDATSMKSFNSRTVSLEEVHRIVTSLPMNKSPGPDKISPCVLKRLSYWALLLTSSIVLSLLAHFQTTGKRLR